MITLIIMSKMKNVNQKRRKKVSFSFLGQFYSLESYVLWRVLFFGEFCSLESFVLWRALFFGELCSVESFVLLSKVLSRDT